ncbi:MAG TPA: dUTP diphosphatase [Clostridiales bacterium]|nr:dUTP diphosphatase [Clostridiales bacterium]
MFVKILKNNDFDLPRYETEGSSGMDLRANVDTVIVLKPYERYLVPTGISIEIPRGYEAQIRARSGLAIKHGISLVNGIGTIDSDYRGEIKVILINLGSEDFEIKKGDRIAQMIFAKVEMAEVREVKVIESSERGSGGFGHTGMN